MREFSAIFASPEHNEEPDAEFEMTWYVARFDTHTRVEIPEDTIVVYAVNRKTNNVKVSVIRREVSRELSQQEKNAPPGKVHKAMHKELKQWLDLQSVQRARLEDAAYLVDGRLVLTWKLIENELGKEVSDMKGRCTLRGFMD